ncbi:hypothetical protein Z948_950 [Sulfitobacter donghicola DSW-25 = KCTC 12864 = JCM 14565]|uniref:Uncharacterized protein n=1 Tax=Sulfitobacter donghicola DSW-25 = KCTC 12864 = JCM 14565 TaxID=1300350 RepID=A0A073IR79_9RHOB|nr:hypothetical protein DSW25_04640 [Sulfitobacter donghicola DSW-25 = KCTC 12864 = JCM 14565]KIN67242.1 hypothetical protein Z948_950 [Sulfitobacter donghicola DSW-25 = KCTC 12864 = JCM 14565]
MADALNWGNSGNNGKGFTAVVAEETHFFSHFSGQPQHA